MPNFRHSSLYVALAGALALTGASMSLIGTSNPSPLVNALANTNDVESTALYCTGLSSVAGGLVGHVTFLNTTDSPRSIAVEIVSDSGQRARTTVQLAGYATRAIQPETLVKGNNYGVVAQVNGGGVVAQEVAANATAGAPCTSTGVTDWYGAGFDTLVGSNGSLSVFNPTATPAVMNVTIYSPSGFAAPAPFQGLSLAAHAQIELNLGSQIVDTANIAVHVNVLRGSIEVLGVQKSGGVVSLIPGSLSTSTSMWFPRVTTANHALSQLRIANPGSQPVNVTVNVGLAPYKVTPQKVTIGAYDTGEVVLSPNTAIPEAGYATVQLSSSRPVIASLAAGSSSGIGLSSPGDPSTNFLLSDFSGRGFDAAVATNTSSHAITLKFATVPAKGHTSVMGSARLGANATVNILGLFSGVTTLRNATLLVSCSKSVLLVTATLPSTPKGVVVFAPLNGR
jgi:hypothetical protein